MKLCVGQEYEFLDSKFRYICKDRGPDSRSGLAQSVGWAFHESSPDQLSPARQVGDTVYTDASYFTLAPVISFEEGDIGIVWFGSKHGSSKFSKTCYSAKDYNFYLDRYKTNWNVTATIYSPKKEQ